MKNSIYSRDVLLVLAASFFFMASPMLVTPLITGFTETLGAGGTIMGLVGGMMNLCSLFCRPLVGNLADRVSKYKISTLGALLMLAATVGYILAWHPLVVMAARVINGVGFACCSVCMATWIADLLPRDKVGAGMGLYGTMNALAMAVAPAIGVTMYQAVGYRTAFAVSALLAAGMALTVQFVGNKGLPSAPKGGRGSFQLIEKKVLPISCITMLFAIPYCATQSFLVTYTGAKSLPVTVSIFFPLYAIALVILRMALKDYFDKLPFGRFFWVACFCALASMGFLTVMQGNPGMVAAALFMAGGYGLMGPVCQSHAILLAGEGKRGLANSTYYIGLDLGMTLGPMLGGMLYENVDIRFFYPVLMFTVPLAVLAHLLHSKKH